MREGTGCGVLIPTQGPGLRLCIFTESLANLGMSKGQGQQGGGCSQGGGLVPSPTAHPLGFSEAPGHCSTGCKVSAAAAPVSADLGVRSVVSVGPQPDKVGGSLAGLAPHPQGLPTRPLQPRPGWRLRVWPV